jgi:MscS family membrane protein
MTTTFLTGGAMQPRTVLLAEADTAPNLQRENSWFFDHLHPRLLEQGPLGLFYWQWLALPLGLCLAWFAGALLGRVTRSVLSRVASRTAPSWHEALQERSPGPFVLAWTVVLCVLLLPFLDLAPSAHAVVAKILHSGLVLAGFWMLFRIVDIGARVASRMEWATAYPASRSLVPLGSRVLKVAIVAIAIVGTLAQFGYPVASLVAGLGIGGLAFALAAQKTVENLFGAFSLGVDQPFREGDFVKIEDFVGTVEAIGLRSTRVRTLDRTLISIPNGKLAELRIESYTARDRLRLACALRLVLETTSEQMRTVLAGLEGVLRAQPKIWPDAVVVRFTGFGDSSLTVEVMAWFLTQDWNEFQTIRQDVLLEFMRVVEAAGTRLAVPTHTVHVASNG